MRKLGRWAVRSMAHDPTLALSPASLTLSFRTLIDRARPAERPMTAALEVTGEAFVARVDGDGIAVVRGEAKQADLHLAGAASGFAAVIYRGPPAAGVLTIGGDPALFARFRTPFPLPARGGA